MSLAEQSQKWFPSHVQVTVLQAKDLQPKGKNRTNDAYTIIQLGKEKYSTSVSEKTLNPVWREEASFELPGLLEETPEIYELSLIVMHRSLVGIDKFLGQRTINLNEIFANKERRKTDWFSLESKPGKKSKERGQVQVSIQFVRNNMTASMFDLSVKEKPRSPFSKLKDRMKGRKHQGVFSDTSSAIVPRLTHCEPDAQSSAEEHQLKPKKKRPQLFGPQKLSMAHSLSDLIHFQPKMGPVASAEDRDSAVSPHRRSHSEVPGHESMAADGRTELFADTLPHKSATLPRNHNPFENERSAAWDKPDWKEKKEKVGLLEWVTGRKEGEKASGESQPGGTADIRSSNPFSSDAQCDTNPFVQHLKTSSNLKQAKPKEDTRSGQKISPLKDENYRKNNDAKQVCVDSYSSLSFDEVVQELIKQKEVVKKKDAHIRELEDYIDDLLVRVMEETPSILRKPYESKKKAEKCSQK